MNPLHALFPLSIASVCLAQGNPANTPAIPVPSDALVQAAMVPIHTADADPVGGAYGTWAAGPNYKVSFHDGMTFTPYLGKSAPRNQSMSWTTTSVRIGNTELLDGRVPSARQVGDYRYEYNHGSVVEAYDVRVDGLEQTFVLHQRPEAHGELVITGSFTGDLAADPRADHHGGMDFVNSGATACVHYGAAHCDRRRR